MSRIGVDVDGVLAHFHDAYIDTCIEVTGKDLFPPRPFDITTWHFPQAYGYTAVDIDQVWSHITASPYFWEHLTPYEDIKASLGCLYERMQQGDDVYFITSRPGRTSKAQTERWLQRYWPYHHVPPLTVLISEHKGMCATALDLDYYIDDRDLNVVDVRSVVWRVTTCATSDMLRKVCLLDRPWNRSLDVSNYGISRIYSLPEMFNPVVH